ncbi:MAG: hypothetical protein L0L73_10250, partial [Acidipropionibacterium jensenii]
MWSVNYEAPRGDVGSADHTSPRGDVHEVRATEFEAVRHTPPGPGFRPAHDGEAHHFGGSFRNLADGYSPTAGEVGHWLTREGDEQS